MSTFISTKDTEIAMAQAKKEGFNKWMNEPMVKAMISMLPPSEHLEIVLQACFEAGTNCGAGVMIGEFVKMMIKKSP